ncbi:MAG: amidase family protein [Burkholderiales bacterium]|nr:MAG: amidase family protein [Burkholderiales bacterium]
MTELWRWDAFELARAIRTRAVSSREAALACLERTDQVNGRLNAIVELAPDAALAAAEAADAAVGRGETLGWLHGVPVTTKINVDQAGSATSNGVVAFRDAVALEDSPVVANLRAAGAVIFGRTNTPAFSFRWFTENDLHGRTLNPWSTGHTPGGSSGGASVAVAAGMGPIAQGNDFAGSIRYPAYCTGVFGLRPSFGRVPAHLPSAPAERPITAPWMSVQGPLARSVRDLRLALRAMAAGDPNDPWWVPAPLEGAAPAHPIRVAFSRSAAGRSASPEVEAAVLGAAGWLSEAGYAIEEVDPPDMAEAAALWLTLAQGEARHFMGEAIARDGDHGIRTAFESMCAHAPVLDAYRHMKALAQRSALVRRWQQFLQRYPLVLTPVSGESAFPWGLDVGGRTGIDRVLQALGPMFMVPVLGLPAVAAPTGVANRLPIGVQIVGPRFREDLVLDAAEVLEARCGPMTPIDPR